MAVHDRTGRHCLDELVTPPPNPSHIHRYSHFHPDMRLPLPTTALLCLAALASSTSLSTGNDILIYKYTSARVWHKYACGDGTNPIETTPSPSEPKKGHYKDTKFWIVDKTTEDLVAIDYDSSGKDDKYFVNLKSSLRRTVGIFDEATGMEVPQLVSALRYLTSEPGADLLGLSFGRHDDPTQRSAEGDLVNADGYVKGKTNPFKVTSDKTLQTVAPNLHGFYGYVNDRTKMDNNNKIVFHSIYLEEVDKVTLDLDEALTKKANSGEDLQPLGGGTPIQNGTIEYGQRLVEGVLVDKKHTKQATPLRALN